MTAPATCTVSGTIYGPDGVAYAGALVRARVYEEPPVEGGDGVLAIDADSTYTDGSGDWSLDLPQGTVVWLEIPVAGVDHLFVVPAVSAARLSDVTLAARQCGGRDVAPSVPTESNVQPAHAVYAGPTSGTALPAFRLLVEGDVPTLTGYLQVANRLSEFSTQAARVAARTNIELEYIDGGSFT
jgi:hypothetical protein